MFKAETHPSESSDQTPAFAAKLTARMMLSHVIPDDISAEKKDKWQRGKYLALLRLMAVSNRHIGRLELPHIVINQMDLPAGFNLTAANLRRSTFKRVSMMEVRLSQSDLSPANLAHCQMKRADLRHATLYFTQLDNTCLDRADLRHANLIQAQLDHAVLNGAKLRYVDLSGAHLRNVDLSGACLRHANLRDTCLNNANLSGAKISLDSISETNFKGAIIDREITLDLSAGWSRYTIDIYLGAGDRLGHGVLQEIDSLNSLYRSLKIALLRQIMDSLQQTSNSLTSVAPSLLTILSSTPYYDEPDIAHWLQEICSQFIGTYDRIMRRQRQDVLRMMLDTFSRYPEIMIDHNAAFIQTIAQVIYACPNTTSAQQAKILYALYLNESRIALYVLKVEREKYYRRHGTLIFESCPE
ncbi:pentapeptide repeat-containing protein [Sodalis glossinidius]|nr:pentapeptide repeat-containing protein [Sodalis glossinidius]